MQGLNEEVQDFDMQQHGSQVNQMLLRAREELFADPKFRILDMLLSKSITPQVKDSHNSLIMKVLKATHPTKHPVRSFVAYERSKSNVFIRLLVTHDEVLRNGYATLLISRLIKSLAEQEIIKIEFETRKQNKRAIHFYDKLLRARNDVRCEKSDTKKDGTEIVLYVVSFLQKGIV